MAIATTTTTATRRPLLAGGSTDDETFAATGGSACDETFAAAGGSTCDETFAAMGGSACDETFAATGGSTDDETLLTTGESPLTHLTNEQLEQLGQELDALHAEVFADLGERDANYIRNTIKLQRILALAGRAMLLRSRKRSLWLLGTASLSLAKVLENMEIGHNVMHGQWDWMNDPYINSQTWDWDTASPAEAWRHSHNYEHHTYTNIRGKDRDLGYEIMRIDPHQRWHPIYLLQPLYNLILMGFFEWGVAVHDLNFEAIRTGEKSKEQAVAELKAIGEKAKRQALKDYTAFPLLSGRSWRRTLAANFTANIVRNVWAHSIIFCGHFPEQTYTFSEREVENETRGGWYVRQLLGSANIEGGKAFHLLAGNLSFQVEHHIFPDMPSNRYAEIAPRVREICERYGLPYNTGPLSRQLGSVHRTILRLALPGGGQKAKAPAAAPANAQAKAAGVPVA